MQAAWIDAWRACAIAADVALATRASPQANRLRSERRLAEFLAWTGSHSVFYRAHWPKGDAAVPRLEELPIVRKAELMADFDAWVTDPALGRSAVRGFVSDPGQIGEACLGRYVVWESSGSTGEPGLFVQDAAAMAVNDALESWRRPLLRPPSGLDPWGLGERIAWVGATGGHFAGTVSVERLRRLNPLLAMRLRSISFLQPIAALVAQLHAFAPAVISTYPSAAVLLAEERLAGRLKLAPREIWTAGECLSAAARRFVQEAFECQVADSYGASEFLSLAFECRRGRLHLNSDWAVLESVDAYGHAVAPGQPGATTLLTNLANRVQPLVRYDLGDRVTLTDLACACGSSMPAIEVDGRDDDTLCFDTGHGSRSVKVLPLAISTVLEEDAGLFDFQLVQQGPHELLLRTGLHGEAAQLALSKASSVLAAFLARQGAREVHIECHAQETARCGRSGKTMRVVRDQARVG
ncbi:MAG TPA: phenylacetate--CoA ligase family protein [Variovorax sp.]